ncbi:MAG: hypothetical protein KDC35_15880 [Acidobacteria bacterium]|nr:hypothetical protein [Acidobacteriota bacterium]
MQVSEIWTAAGVVLGFQVTSFLWRISNEVARGSSGDITWLPPADILNLVAMVVLVVGVFIAPMAEESLVRSPHKAFGLALILFVGHCFALAGHYDMFNPRTPRSMKYFPLQELVAVGVVIAVAVAYCVLV